MGEVIKLADRRRKQLVDHQLYAVAPGDADTVLSVAELQIYGYRPGRGGWGYDQSGRFQDDKRQG